MNELRITNTKLIYRFLLVMPFIGIISNRLTPLIAYSIICFFIFTNFAFKMTKENLSSEHLLYLLIMIYTLILNFLFQLMRYNFVNLYFIQFFGSQLIFYLIFTLFLQIDRLISKLNRLFLILTVFVSVAIIIDAVLIKMNMKRFQASYYDGLPIAYLSKPLGLFGQFSINSTYVVVFFLLYLATKDNKKNSIKDIVLFFIITISVIIENSGTGYIIYIFLILAGLLKFRFTNYLIIPISLILLINLVKTNLFSKISLEYITFIFNYFIEIINNLYLVNVNDIFDILFGIDGNYNLPIDFGYLFIIGKVGLIYFILYSAAIVYFIIKSPNRYFKIAIFSLFIANIHYPALFYPIMNVLLPVLFLYVVKVSKTKKQVWSIE